MNIIILSAGSLEASQEGHHSHVLLTELSDGLLVERLVNSVLPLEPNRILFAIKSEDVRRYYLDNVIRLLSPKADVAPINAKTAGAACTALLLACELPQDEELLLLASTEIVDVDMHEVVAGFRSRDLDAGAISFRSVHPRYSYVRLNDEGFVVEASEKRPITRNATAGFYWFRRAGDFVKAVQSMLRKDAHVDGNFYICPCFNQMILTHARIGVHHIPSEAYRPVKSAHQHDVIEMESRLDRAGELAS